MEDINNQGTIDSKYTIINKKGHGQFGNVFLVEDTTNNARYAAKVSKKKSHTFQNEIDILNELNELNNPYIIRMITSGEGVINRNNTQKTSQYIILENAPNKELLKYIRFPNTYFDEKLGKLIFYKILKGIQAIHEAGICHRDIKTDNILFDENFNIKICDFGFSTHNNENLTEILGTPSYIAPEIFAGKKYNGFKADIFSLGVVLFTLITGMHGFGLGRETDKYYQYIAFKYIGTYWNKFSKLIPEVSEEFKKLYIQMVAFKPENRPENIEEILNSEWMKEIKDMKEEELEQLEEVLKAELIKRKDKIDNYLENETETQTENEDLEESSGTRGGNSQENKFNLSLKPKFAKTGLNMEYYIKLKGYEINPAKFMNKLYKKIEKEFEDDECLIEFYENKLKFDIVFNEEKNEEANEEDLIEEVKKLKIEDEENENITEKNTVIRVKIFESYKGGYILRFTKKEGELDNYLERLKIIYSLIIKKNN